MRRSMCFHTQGLLLTGFVHLHTLAHARSVAQARAYTQGQAMVVAELWRLAVAPGCVRCGAWLWRLAVCAVALCHMAVAHGCGTWLWRLAVCATCAAAVHACTHALDPDSRGVHERLLEEQPRLWLPS